MDSSTFMYELKKAVKRLDQPVNLSGVGSPGERIEIEAFSGNKAIIALIKNGDEISITTKNDRGQSSFNVSSDTGMFAVDAVLRVL